MVRRLGENEKEKDMLSFPSSSFDAVTTTTTPNAAAADDAKAQAYDSFDEETAHGTAGANGLFETPAAADGFDVLDRQRRNP